MAKKKTTTTKYITLSQGWQYDFCDKFFELTGMKARRLGYRDESTTTYVFSVKTSKSVREVQDLVWELNGGGWADVSSKNPRQPAPRLEASFW